MLSAYQETTEDTYSCFYHLSTVKEPRVYTYQKTLVSDAEKKCTLLFRIRTFHPFLALYYTMHGILILPLDSFKWQRFAGGKKKDTCHSFFYYVLMTQ